MRLTGVSMRCCDCLAVVKPRLKQNTTLQPFCRECANERVFVAQKAANHGSFTNETDRNESYALCNRMHSNL